MLEDKYIYYVIKNDINIHSSFTLIEAFRMSFRFKAEMIIGTIQDSDGTLINVHTIEIYKLAGTDIEEVIRNILIEYVTDINKKLSLNCWKSLMNEIYREMNETQKLNKIKTIEDFKRVFELNNFDESFFFHP